jgi:hypothetical protein
MKTLHIDIETSPNLAYVWGLFKQNVGLNQIVKPARMICASYAWEFDDTEFVAEWQKGGRRRMLRTLHDALAEADAVVHYNGKSFDTPHIFREFVEHGFGPPAPFAQIDLYQAVKRNFRFASGKLAHVAEALELDGGKLATDMTLWTRVLEGDAEARAEMEAYNRRDVVLLQDLYDRILPWIPGHPNVGLYDDTVEPACTKCGSANVIKNGRAFTSAGAFQRYQCRDCGAWSRGFRRDATTPLRSAVIA